MSGYNPETGERTEPVVWKDGVPAEPHIGSSNKKQELEFRIAEAQKQLDRLGGQADDRSYETQVIPGSDDTEGVPAKDEVAALMDTVPEKAAAGRKASESKAAKKAEPAKQTEAKK